MHANSEPSIYPVTLINKRTLFKSGSLFLNVTYKPISSALIYNDWPLKLNNPGNKFEFFNENLMNAFRDDCQFGYLTVELSSMHIPLMS
jgi:hypothetical protein